MKVDVEDAWGDVNQRGFDVNEASFDVNRRGFDVNEASVNVNWRGFDVIEASFDVNRRSVDVEDAPVNVNEASVKLDFLANWRCGAGSKIQCLQSSKQAISYNLMLLPKIYLNPKPVLLSGSASLSHRGCKAGIAGRQRPGRVEAASLGEGLLMKKPSGKALKFQLGRSTLLQARALYGLTGMNRVGVLAACILHRRRGGGCEGKSMFHTKQVSDPSIIQIVKQTKGANFPTWMPVQF